MNKHLMLSAAALLGATATASAETHSFQFATPGGASYCDGGTVNTNGIFWAWMHTNNNCAGGVSTGMGVLGKFKGLGKGAFVSDNYFGSAKSIAMTYMLPKKLKNGSVWSLWICFSGVSCFEGNSGILINATPGHKGTGSTLAKVKTLIQAHRNARQKTQ